MENVPLGRWWVIYFKNCLTNLDISTLGSGKAGKCYILNRQEVSCSMNKCHSEALLRWKALTRATEVNWVTSILLWFQRSNQWNHRRQGHWHLAPLLTQDKPRVLSPRQNAAVRAPRPDRWECSTPESPSPDYSHCSTAHKRINQTKCSCYINIWRAAIAFSTLVPDAML